MADAGDYTHDVHSSFLVHARFRWLKIALLLCIVSIIAYFWTDPDPVPNGGTWTGYTLGTIGLVLILWLTWLGVRKRRVPSGTWSLKGWTSAHVYLGLALIVVATLHSGFQLGWNVHTLAYTLMMLVIASGIFGIFAYARYPAMMSANRRSATRREMLQQIADFDDEAQRAAQNLDDSFVKLVQSAAETRIGGGFMRQISGNYPNCKTTRALREARRMSAELPPEKSGAAERLLEALGRKAEALGRIRADIRYKSLMEVWLWFHVPLAIALIAALTAHVVSVLFYW